MKLIGGMCAIATPFKAGGEIDVDALTRLIDYQLEEGSHALIVAGSTGEAHFLAPAEYDQLLKHVVKRVAGRVPVVAGTGASGTRETIDEVRHAAELGADVALVVTPYYVRPTQHGLVTHYRAVADASPLPVLLYNVPSRTACDMQPQTVAQLASHANIVGIKEAVGTPERIAAISQLVDPASFAYFSGDDYTASDAMLAGATGTISVVANIVPKLFGEICDAAVARDRKRLDQGLARLQPLLDAMQCGPNPIPVKAGLALLGLCDGSLRLPLEKIEDDASIAALRAALREIVPERVAA